MSRGNQYPSERFDGSPFFLGKKRKPQQAGESETDPGRPLTDLNGRLSTDSEQFVIVESDSETRQDVQEQPVRKKCNIFREDSANSVANTKGTNFDFSADVEVQALNKAVMSVIDPDGKRRNDNRLQSDSVANVSAKKNEILGSGVTASGSSSFDRNSGARFARKSPVRGGGGKKKTSTTIRGGWNFGDLAGDFRSASGSTKIQKEVKAVVPLRSDSQSSSQSDSGLPPGSKFLGNKRITASSVTGSTFGSKRPPVSMTMGTDGGGRDQQKNGCSLKADNPSLKNFEDNIITLIESEIMLPQSDIGWADVAGLEAAKKALREIVVLPFKRPDIFKGIRAPPKGVLLFGPPGTGKTMIGKCVASQSKATFFNISASSLTSKWVGEGEKLVRALFAVARIKLPSVIFIDEIDSLLSSRSESEHESSRRIKTEFLVQLDGVATNSDERLLVLGATNRPYELDEAARRRFAKRLYIALPETEARLRIIRNLLTNMEHALHETDYEQIGRLTEGYSGADMRQLCSEAAMGPIREIDAMEDADIETIPAERIRPISGRDFIEAARLVRATVVADDLQVYANWDKKFGCLL